ncbi:MAG: Rpn family recombination-promoting nuclease/putative transposase [Spirochaetaceae bacterium]|nr:Rpn family recombination-promoting nuclease/putative transposase [Spirochaetaceae bacterium]
MQNEKPINENRKHKDSLFVDYFSKDRDWKQHFLSLYNALHGTNLQVETTSLERVNLEQVLYKSYYNDIAVLVDGQFILMIEHQSTINPNMPLRLLEYVARIYGNIVDSTAKFSRHLVPLAKPEFIVFYTGDQELPPESYLYLSDAFPKQGQNADLTLELKVKVCTIKSETPSPVVHSCTDLEQYVQFLQLVEEAKAAGHEAPLKWAIQEAVRRNILRDYLERKGGEVLSILMTEYDYATDMAVLKEEAYEDGLFVGREEGISIGLERGRATGREEGAYETKLETARSFLSMGLEPEQVAQGTGLSLEIILQLID